MTEAERRAAVFFRARGRCEYCGCPADFSSSDFAVEHIFPRSHFGFSDALENLALSCQGCNNRKFTAVAATDPVMGELVPLFHPRKDLWEEHFTWSDDALLLLPKTAIARATTARLQLNRPGVINVRRGLIALGEHPLTEILAESAERKE